MGIKNFFLRLTIKQQITMGMLSLTSLICGFIIVVIGVNYFIFFIVTSEDIEGLLERTEDQTLNSLAILFDLTQMVIFQKAKVESQIVYFYIEHAKRRKLLDNLSTSVNISKWFMEPNGTTTPAPNILNCQGNIYDCKYLQQRFDTSDNTNEKYYLVTLIPNNRLTINYKSDLDIFLIERLLYSNHETKSQYVFPLSANVSSHNVNFTENSFEMNKYNWCSYYDTILKLIVQEFNHIKTYSLDELGNKNPFISMSRLNENILQIEQPYTTTQPFFMNMINFHYKPHTPTNQEELFDYMSDETNINSYSIIELDSTLYDSLLMKEALNFPGIILAASQTGLNNYITTYSSCFFLRKISSLFNPTEINLDQLINSELLQFQDCFFDKAKDQVHRIFINDTHDTKEITRKAIVNIGKYRDKLIFYDDRNYKITQYISPSESTRRIYSSAFYNDYVAINYILKHRIFLEISKNKVYMERLGSIYMWVLGNLLIWVAIFIIISIQTLIMAKTISVPFNELSKKMFFNSDHKAKDTNNPSSMPNENVVQIHEFKFDRDINELFQLCDEFLKGGYQDNSKKAKGRTINAYNSISMVKTNNLFFNEKELYSQKAQNLELIFNNQKSSSKRKQNETKLTAMKLFSDASKTSGVNSKDNSINRTLKKKISNDFHSNEDLTFFIESYHKNEKISMKKNNYTDQVEVYLKKLNVEKVKISTVTTSTSIIPTTPGLLEKNAV